jgi:aryl-alcohol dehydrogenase-like predicted oxidoreductase
MEYSPWTLDVEGASGTHLLKTCEELGVSIFAYHPLGSGMLTGKYRSTADFSGGGFDLRSVLSRFKSENFDKNLEVADKFVKIAEKHGYTGSQLALAWLLAQSDLVFVIPGTKRVKYLEENWGAATIELTKEEDLEVRALVDQGEVIGDRDNLVGHFIDTVPLES